MLGKVAHWWRTAESSNIILLVLIFVLVAYWADLKKETDVAEEKAVEAVRVIGENNEAAIAALKRARATDERLDSYEEFLDDSENLEYLNTLIPSDIYDRM